VYDIFGLYKIEGVETQAKQAFLSGLSFKGEEIDEVVEVNPTIITNQFFKPIIPLTAKINYNGEQLSMLYEYYNDLLLDINDFIGPFPTSLTLFCRFIGVTLDDFKNLRDEADETTKIVVQKIIDDIDDANLSMAQTGSLREKPTLFRLKAQNEMIEKVTPKVNVNIKANIDDNRIKGNILDYEEFLGKKG
jgi:hypothetical protein